MFIKTLYGFEDFFEKRIRANYYVRHMGAMLLIGIMMYVMLRIYGYYYIEGVGYATVQDILNGILTNVPLLLLLFALKLIATSLTLGSGASGGVFSPAFFMGATLGGGYGLVCNWLFPSLGIGTTAFAVAGMAGSVGGATGAAMAAIVMIFEMTRDYNVIIPITITVALSYGIRRAFCPESIYTLKLVRRGRHAPWALHADLGQVQIARDLMRSADAAERSALAERIGHPGENPVIVAKADARLDEILEEMHRVGAATAVVSESGTGGRFCRRHTGSHFGSRAFAGHDPFGRIVSRLENGE